jgi:AcrR family transcriptional regulator/catechol 2,3-dioxygenase-like lactoylglutathione lyase family enzyme
MLDRVQQYARRDRSADRPAASTLEGVSETRSGRPRASSREVLAEAACELFLERGYDATSVSDITRRVGVSRSSFFNYFSSKADVLWRALDERIASLGDRLRDETVPDLDSGLRAAVSAVVSGLQPDSLALAWAQSDAMGLTDELAREASVRRGRIADAVGAHLRQSGVDPLRADVLGAAYGGAVLAAIRHWARAGAGRVSLPEVVADALDAVPSAARAGAVRQLRVVVRADDIDDAVRFFRDALGMPERASFEGDGDARVVILSAGSATLELANAAQVDMIDAVETDGDAPSERIRLALEVDDARALTDTLAASGAHVEATARRTPWGSRNSRLRAPAELQVTLFDESAEA